MGGADCIERDGTKLYRPPSQLENYWATNQQDQAAFAAWCYDVQKQQADMAMAAIKKNIKDDEI